MVLFDFCIKCFCSCVLSPSVIHRNVHVVESISVPFRGPPRYNPRRRSAIGWPIVSGGGGGGLISSGNNHYGVMGHGGSLMSGSATMIDLRTLTRLGMVGPPSPCPSDQPFSSASSSLSEGSSHRSNGDDISIVTGNTSDK